MKVFFHGLKGLNYSACSRKNGGILKIRQEFYVFTINYSNFEAKLKNILNKCKITELTNVKIQFASNLLGAQARRVFGKITKRAYFCMYQVKNENYIYTPIRHFIAFF